MMRVRLEPLATGFPSFGPYDCRRLWMDTEGTFKAELETGATLDLGLPKEMAYALVAEETMDPACDGRPPADRPCEARAHG